MPDNCRAVYLYSIWYFAYIVTADCLYAVLGDFGLSYGFALPLTLALRMVHYRERTQGQDCAGITR